MSSGIIMKYYGAKTRQVDSKSLAKATELLFFLSILLNTTVDGRRSGTALK